MPEFENLDQYEATNQETGRRRVIPIAPHSIQATHYRPRRREQFREAREDKLPPLKKTEFEVVSVEQMEKEYRQAGRRLGRGSSPRRASNPLKDFLAWVRKLLKRKPKPANKTARAAEGGDGERRRERGKDGQRRRSDGHAKSSFGGSGRAGPDSGANSGAGSRKRKRSRGGGSGNPQARNQAPAEGSGSSGHPASAPRDVPSAAGSDANSSRGRRRKRNRGHGQPHSQRPNTEPQKPQQ